MNPTQSAKGWSFLAGSLRYSSAYLEREDQVSQTLSLFDPLLFAPTIEAETLLTCGEGGQPLADRIAGVAELRVNTGRTYLDHQYKESWLTQRFI